MQPRLYVYEIFLDRRRETRKHVILVGVLQPLCRDVDARKTTAGYVRAIDLCHASPNRVAELLAIAGERLGAKSIVPHVPNLRVFF